MSTSISGSMPTARQIAQDVAQGKTTCEAVVRAHLERIEACEPAIGAWKFLDKERAIAEARSRDQGQGGAGVPLRGVPVGVKDVFDTADMPTGYGSAAYPAFTPAADAFSVAALRQAGGIALGKTVSTEFAAMAPGGTRNPHNSAHTPGGSSSGSAAAVAAGMVPLALGTQTSGSTIRPAAFCGVVGYKPTFGMIDRTGVKALSGSLDTVGIFARNVGDAAFFAAVLSARPHLALNGETAKPRFGLYRTPHWESADSASASAVEGAAAAMRGAGFSVLDVAPLSGFEYLIELHHAIMGFEASRTLAFERWNKNALIADKTRAYLQESEAITFEAYDNAQRLLMNLRARVAELFGDCDVLITPSSTGPAPLGLDSTGDPTFNRGWTSLHVPCVTIPAGLAPNGLPVGVQFIARPHDDALVLAAAAAAETVLAR